MSRIITGDCLTVLKGLPAASVHCCVTSPPYWGLRDYGIPPTIWADGESCCLGLEASTEMFVAHIVEIFREVWRVLRPDGTCWVNMGDSYAGSGKGIGSEPDPKWVGARNDASKHKTNWNNCNLKPKDLCMIPARVALALQADGWFLRSQIIWAKGVSFCDSYSGSVMPESCRDRPTSAYECVYLLSKKKNYYYDSEAVREYAIKGGANAGARNYDWDNDGRAHGGSNNQSQLSGRNLRNVWTINPQPYPEAHFATYPPELIRPAIKAGTSERGCCPKSGAPWVRVVERPKPPASVYTDSSKPDSIKPVSHPEIGKAGMGQKLQNWYNENPTMTTGWQPSCECQYEQNAAIAFIASGIRVNKTVMEQCLNIHPIPCTVLDPFAGSGTTGVVCIEEGRDYILIEINPEYVEKQLKPRLNATERRLDGIDPKRDDPKQMTLF